jgi:hypothetical protein
MISGMAMEIRLRRRRMLQVVTVGASLLASPFAPTLNGLIDRFRSSPWPGDDAPASVHADRDRDASVVRHKFAALHESASDTFSRGHGSSVLPLGGKAEIFDPLSRREKMTLAPDGRSCFAVAFVARRQTASP